MIGEPSPNAPAMAKALNWSSKGKLALAARSVTLSFSGFSRPSAVKGEVRLKIWRSPAPVNSMRGTSQLITLALT